MKGELTGIDLRADEHKEVVRLLQHHLPDTEVWAYGSRVKGTARPASDLNLVTFASAGQKEAVSRLREAFDESPLPFRVDLFVWDKVPEEFRKNIEETRVVVQEKEKKNLPKGWETVAIGEISEVIGGGTPSSKVDEYWGGSIPWLTPKDLSGYDFRRVKSGKRNITDSGLANSSARLLPKNTVLVTSRAPIGYVALADNQIATNQGFKSLILNDGYDPDFFYYLIKHNVPTLEAASSGTTFKEISGKAFKQIKFNVPPLPEQKAIAHILGSLDDKIELNRRMNETLAAMAQALFKSWFVDFDPVIDNALAAGNAIPDKLKEKAAIRQGPDDKRKSLPDDIRRLFPSEFAYTEEMGWVPKGWEIKNLDQIGVFKNGLALQKFPPIEGEEILPVVKIAQLRKGNATGSDLFASRIADDFIINDGDFIFSWSGSLLAKFWVGGKGALNQHLFKVEGKEHPLWFVAGWVHQHMPEFCAIAENKATTMGHIKKEHLSQAQCIGPGQKVLKKLEVCIAQLINRQIFVQQESRALAELRDTLLPKLLSAEISVEQAKQMLEDRS